MTRSIPGTTACSILCVLLSAALFGCGGSGSARTDGPVLAGGSTVGSGGVVQSGGVAGSGTGGRLRPMAALAQVDAFSAPVGRRVWMRRPPTCHRSTLLLLIRRWLRWTVRWMARGRESTRSGPARTPALRNRAWGAARSPSVGQPAPALGQNRMNFGDDWCCGRLRPGFKQDAGHFIGEILRAEKAGERSHKDKEGKHRH